MVEWSRKVGYEVVEYDRLNTIHVAGTKGKGSTSAFISSILSQYAETIPALKNIGLYTSPHLRFVRERIQMNNEPISESVFASYFFSIWDRLTDAAAKAGLPDPEAAAHRPVYFRYLTLMALHTYMSLGVGTAVIEVGIGGEYDSTNILVHPSVTAITSLGIDHVPMLGSTIEEISWHKAGIMKSGTPCFTAPQPPAALEVLKQRAREKNVDLEVVDVHPELATIKLGLAADFQKINASLAIAVAAAHLHRLGHHQITTSPLPTEFRRGLEQVRWSGRCETRVEDNISWHLDGGHTLESIDIAAQWYASVLSSTHKEEQTRVPTPNPKPVRVLIFNQQLRAAEPLLVRLHETLSSSSSSSLPPLQRQPFTHVLFCSNVTFRKTGYKPDLVSVNSNSEEVGELSVQTRLAEVWNDLEGRGGGRDQAEGSIVQVRVLGTIEEAVDVVRGLASQQKLEGSGRGGVSVLVTGSVHLVGGVLEVLESGTEGADGGGSG